MELEKVKKRRLEREREKEERDNEQEMMQREKEIEYFREWEKQEDSVCFPMPSSCFNFVIYLLFGHTHKIVSDCHGTLIAECRLDKIACVTGPHL